MGSAGVIVLDERGCMVQLGIRVAEFYEHESCGKCTPCREGTRWMTAILRKLEDGRRGAGRARPAADVCDRINGKCLCPLGDSDAIIVATYVGEVPRGVPARTSTKAAARSTALSARPRARTDRHAHAHARREVPHASAASAKPTPPHMLGSVEPTPMSSPEVVTVTIDEREVQVAQGHRARRERRRRRHRDPCLLLRAAARRAGRRLPHVPRRGGGDAEARRPAAR